MNQNIFERKQRATEFLTESIKIWKRSEKGENLEGLETDPIFKMLLTAVAYQANEQESNLEAIKEDFLNEFAGVISRGEGLKAIPSSFVISTDLADGVQNHLVNSSDDFTLSSESGKSFHLTPLLKTKAINSSIKSVTRLDSRRWEVKLAFPEKVSNLSGFCFGTKRFDFGQFEVSLADSGKELLFAAPWNYANYPVADHFSLETLLFNRYQSVNVHEAKSLLSPYNSFATMDLFARTEMGLFVFEDMEDFEPTTTLKLIFEFKGIGKDFTFTEKDLLLNVLILVNASRKTLHLSSDHPIAKIESQFLHLLKPSKDNLMLYPVQVRRIMAERFNEGRLLELLYHLTTKYSSDYYAFESIGSDSTDSSMHEIQKHLSLLLKSFKEKIGNVAPGDYAILDTKSTNNEQVSFSLDYLVTEGTEVNTCLDSKYSISVPQFFVQDSVRCLSHNVGFDQILNKEEERYISKYYLSTEDRIVTPYDMKLFCYTQLFTHYGLDKDLVDHISVHTKEVHESGIHRVEEFVTIVMKSNDFFKRAYSDKLESIESYLSKMIFVRTNGLFPINVKIIIN